jgi:hypothetical protein
VPIRVPGRNQDHGGLRTWLDLPRRGIPACWDLVSSRSRPVEPTPIPLSELRVLPDTTITFIALIYGYRATGRMPVRAAGEQQVWTAAGFTSRASLLLPGRLPESNLNISSETTVDRLQPCLD